MPLIAIDSRLHRQSSALLVLAVGGEQILHGVLTYGDLSAFLLYSMMSGFGAGNVATAYTEFRRASGASERVLQLLEPLPADRERKRRATLSVGDGGDVAGATARALAGAGAVPVGQVDFEHVSFAYPSAPGRPVLSQLDLHVAAGERVALLGASGAGKSTIAALLAGLYTPQRGRVLLGGVDVDTIEREHLRTRLLSVVPQAC